jgi:hypothetical protein
MRLVQAACCVGVVGALTAVTVSSSVGCSAASQVRQVYMALDGTGVRPRDTFYTDSSAIYCDVVYSGRSTDSTVEAEFLQTQGEANLYEGTGNLIATSRLWTAGEQVPATGNSTVSFNITPPTAVDGGATLPFPVGHWQCIVSVNGEKAGTADFDVKYPTPDCPADNVASAGASCTAYMMNATCPSASNSAGSATACTCSGAGFIRVWTDTTPGSCQ